MQVGFVTGADELTETHTHLGAALKDVPGKTPAFRDDTDFTFVYGQSHTDGREVVCRVEMPHAVGTDKPQSAFTGCPDYLFLQPGSFRSGLAQSGGDDEGRPGAPGDAVPYHIKNGVIGNDDSHEVDRLG